jgi:hypothetical protein
MSNNTEKVIMDYEEDDYEDEQDYCLGCDSGIDSRDAHNESCNIRLYQEGYECYEDHEGHECVSSTPEPRGD